MIIVKSPREIDLMRTASRIVAEIHLRLKEKVVPGVTTLELDRLAEEWTKELGSTPAFKGYRGYQHTLCISVNEVVVHGIPTDKRTRLSRMPMRSRCSSSRAVPRRRRRLTSSRSFAT